MFQLSNMQQSNIPFVVYTSTLSQDYGHEVYAHEVYAHTV